VASAALEGHRYELDDVRAGTVTDPVLQGALRVAREMDGMAASATTRVRHCRHAPERKPHRD